MSEEEKAKRKEYSRKYYQEHKEQIKARQREKYRKMKQRKRDAEN